MWATLQLQTHVRYVTVQQKYPGLKIVVQIEGGTRDGNDGDVLVLL